MSPEHVTIKLAVLVSDVGNLNPNVAEIGAGRLATLVQRAQEVAPYIDRLAGVVADGLLLRDLLAITLDADKCETLADVIHGIESAPGFAGPTTVDAARAQLFIAIDQTKRIHP
jgi:hypothetical protein